MNSCVLLGHNGAGKSTIIKYILGLYPDIKSHPYLNNLHSSFTQLKDQKHGFAPEIAYLENSCTAKDYIKLFVALRGINNFNEIAKELDFSIDLEKKISNYSKGMKHLLSLCLAFLGKPDSVILDEPTSGLDFFVSKVVMDFIINQSKQTELIVATHSLDFAFRLDLPIMILKQGAICEYKKFNSFNELEQSFLASKP